VLSFGAFLRRSSLMFINLKVHRNYMQHSIISKRMYAFLFTAAILLGIAFIATNVHANTLSDLRTAIRSGQTVSNAASSNALSTNTNATNAASANLASASLASGQPTLARSIVCTVFGILSNLGVLPFNNDCNNVTPPPPPPQPPPPPPPPAPQAGTLTVFKVVNGGSATPGQFTLHASGVGSTSTTTFPGSTNGISVSVPAGNSYAITEDASSSYMGSFSANCSGVMPAGASRTCIVTNTFQAPQAATGTLKVIKIVNGGTATSSNFSVHVMSGSSDVSGSPQAGTMSGTTYTLNAGSYTVSESGGPSNYVASFSGDCNSSGTVSVASSTNRVCTITNTFNQPVATGTLKVIKVVNGGTASSSAFMIHVMSGSSEVSGSPQVGSISGSTYTLNPGSYTVSETGGPSGYTSAMTGDCNGNGVVSVASSTDRVCTITNSFTASTTGMIRVIKTVVGGTATSSNFQIHLMTASSSSASSTEVSGSPQGGTVSGTTYSGLAAGNYVVSETGGPTGFVASFSGDCNSSGVITAANSTLRTCTITNTFQGGSLNVIKTVVGGTATSSNFTIHLVTASSTTASSTEVTGSPFAGTSSSTAFSLLAGNYVIFETGGPSGHTLGFGGDCSATGTISILAAATTTKTCTLTNTFTASSTI
jgi:hypothetical protein